MSSSDLEDVKTSIRAVLVSSQNKLTVEDLRREYRSLEGKEIPYREFGYRTIREFLLSNQDIVQLQNPEDNNSIVYAKSNQKTAHIENLVSGQKQSTKKPSRLSRSRPNAYSHSYNNSCTARPPRFANSSYSQTPRRCPRVYVESNRKEPLPHDFRVAVRDMLLKYPNGMPEPYFESGIGRLLMNYHYEHRYSTDDILDEISDFAYKQLGCVYRRQVNTYVQPPLAPSSPREVTISDSDEIEDADELEDADDMPCSGTAYYMEKNKQCTSRSNRESCSPTASSDETDDRSTCTEELVSQNLVRCLRSLFDDPKNRNGIWLTELAAKFQEKYFYVLNPREHNFRDMLDLVSNLPCVFSMQQYRLEGDFYLRDARKYKTDTVEPAASEIPKSVMDELKKLLKNKKSLFTDELFREYEKMYHKTMKLESFGFTSKDEFLKNLEDVCSEIKFRTVNCRTQMMLEHTQDEQEPKKSDALPVENDYYNPIPKEACEVGFSLPEQRGFENIEIGEEFDVVMAEVYSPVRFYVHLKKDINTLDTMMEDLNIFYETNESQYTVYSATATRNLLCACVYPVDSRWHRVRILQTKLAEAKVSFIDYGTSEDVNISQLKYLHKDFSKLPAMCMRAKLAGVKPKDDSSHTGVYSREVGDAFFQYTNGDGLMAKLLHYDPNCLELTLHRIREPTGEILTVHEELINLGLVDRKNDLARKYSYTESIVLESDNTSMKMNPKDRKSDLVQINENIEYVTATDKPFEAFANKNGVLPADPLQTERSENVESRPVATAKASPEESTLKQVPQGPPPGFAYSPAMRIPPPAQVPPPQYQSAQFNTIYHNTFQAIPTMSPNVSPPFYAHYVYPNTIIPPPLQTTIRPPPGFECMAPMYGRVIPPTVPAAATPSTYSQMYNTSSDVYHNSVKHNESCMCTLCPDQKKVPAAETLTNEAETSPEYVTSELLEKYKAALDVSKTSKNIVNNRISESTRERIGVESKLSEYFELESRTHDSKVNLGDLIHNLQLPKKSNISNKFHNDGQHPEFKPTFTSEMPLPERIVEATEFIPKAYSSKFSNPNLVDQTFDEPRSTSSPKITEGKKSSKLNSIRDLVLKHKNIHSSSFN